MIQLSAGARAPQMGDVLKWGPDGWEPSAQQREWNRIHVHTETRTRIVMGVWQSPDFVTGSAGWRFAQDGSLEANDITARGTVYATAGEIGGWSIGANLSAGGITLDPTTPAIRVGEASAFMVGAGVWIGKDGEIYKLHIGNPSADHLYWNGTTLYLSGNISSSTLLLGTKESSFTINTAALDVDVQLRLERATGGPAVFTWNGDIVQCDEPFKPSVLIVDQILASAPGETWAGQVWLEP